MENEMDRPTWEIPNGQSMDAHSTDFWKDVLNFDIYSTISFCIYIILQLCLQFVPPTNELLLPEVALPPFSVT